MSTFPAGHTPESRSLRGHFQGVNQTPDSDHKNGRVLQVVLHPARLALGAMGGARQRVLNSLPSAVNFTCSEAQTWNVVWNEDRPAEQAVLNCGTQVSFDPQCQGQLFRLFQWLSSRHGLQIAGKGLLGRSVTSLLSHQAGSSSPGTP
jgi:hypothetical protein